MPSAVSATAQPEPVKAPAKKFKTVFGFGAVFGDADAPPPSTFRNRSLGRNASLKTRASLDTTARSYRQKRKDRVGRSSVTDVSFFDSQQPPAVDIASGTGESAANPTSIPDTAENMKSIDANHPRPSRRPPVRMDAQDGPWSVSVAETPHDSRSYSLYIKTPTHNLTLTRTTNEIVELHQKLREAYPSAKLPKLPIDASTLPAPPPKRKSTFLNTLSRLASPSAGRSARQAPNRASTSSAIPSTLPTPITSPSQEITDPFTNISAPNGTADGKENAENVDNSTKTSLTTTNSTITSVAAYLTTVSNEPTLNQARAWKRFVRVRTDDLESVRVERAIKRVRSDLAAHVSSKPASTPTTPSMNGNGALSSSTSEVESVDDSGNEFGGDGESSRFREEGIEEEDEDASIADEAGAHPDIDDEARPDSPHSTGTSKGVDAATSPSSAPIDIPAAASATKDDDDTNGPNTPIATEPSASRIPRSQSADPDKASRLSRVFTHTDGASSQTEDNSSISTSGGGRTRGPRKVSDTSTKEKKKSQRKVVIDDFEMMRVLGKGCAGKVLLVRHKSTTDLYALKAITKRHVLAHQELQHTLTEQAVLKRMAAESKDPFVVKLWWSFHDKENLFLVMDFHPGGDLATQLARWGRLGRDRARFYAAEIVEGVEGLHAAGVIYRDLKPENILIGADGHIVLTDFGLSKEFPRRTASATAPSTPSGSRNEFYSSVPGTPQPASPPWMKGEKGELASGWPGQPVGQSDTTSTFCGTAEYLAPEVIQGLPYSYEVDWWSFGTMLYEMLTGITPFWANNHSDMYVRVLQDELQFPDDRAIDQDTKSLIRGLLQRNPGLRMCEPRIKKHPYFSMIDWSHVYYKRYIPPYIPPIDPSNASDTQNFDDTFLDMAPVIDDGNDNDQSETDQEQDQTDTDRTDGEESNTTPSQSRSSSIHAREDDSLDVFDGYSYKGRHSILIDDEDEEERSEEEEDADADVEIELNEDMSTGAPETVSHVAPSESTLAVDTDVPEPKTPEARSSKLPDTTTVTTTPTEAPQPSVSSTVEGSPRKTKERDAVKPSEAAVPAKEPKAKHNVLSKHPRPAQAVKAATRSRREKSGVPALDRYLSDGVDEDAEVTEREDEDDDWDFVEAADGEDRNGAKGNSLFARGVVDRYRLAVFRKASTPTQRPVGSRSVSGMSKASDLESAADSPTPSEKVRRGRNPGLTFRKNPRQFLRPKSPPPSSRSSATAKSLSHSNSATVSAASTASSAGLLTPSPSMGSTLPPSLKSKESAVSVGNSVSSDQSGNGDTVGDTMRQAVPVKPSAAEDAGKPKPKKLKKYKEGAEKVFAIFQQSPRQPQS